MANYAGGRAFEYLVRDCYRKTGHYVIRAAGSRGVVDLIAWNDRSADVIQCKKERKKKSYKDDIRALQKLVVPQLWRKWLFVKSKTLMKVYRITKNEVELVEEVPMKGLREWLNAD